jgi:hypothetical protein
MYRNLFKTNKIFRNSSLLIGGLASDLLLSTINDYLYSKTENYDEKFKNMLRKLYIKDDIEYFKDDKLFNIRVFGELPLHATLEELALRDCVMRYLLMTRVGLGPTISNFIQAAPFSIMHDTIKPSEISDYANKNLNEEDRKSISNNIDEKYNTFNYFYYGNLYIAGLLYGGITLLSKTIWIPSVIHTVHNQLWYYETRKEYNEKNNDK